MNQFTFSAAVALSLLVGAGLNVCASTPKVKIVPQEVCQSAVAILAQSDAMCLIQPNDIQIGGRDWQHYDCIDKEGHWFLVTRTPGDKS